jgi:hypothetical protein
MRVKINGKIFEWLDTTDLTLVKKINQANCIIFICNSISLSYPNMVEELANLCIEMHKKQDLICVLTGCNSMLVDGPWLNRVDLDNYLHSCDILKFIRPNTTPFFPVSDKGNGSDILNYYISDLHNNKRVIYTHNLLNNIIKKVLSLNKTVEPTTTILLVNYILDFNTIRKNIAYQETEHIRRIMEYAIRKISENEEILEWYLKALMP